MVSNGFDGGIGELLERSDGRYKYVQNRDEQCLSSLVRVGRTVRALRSVPAELTTAYLATLDEINDQYFEAREFERDVRGKFYRYDETAEQQFRSTIVEELSDCAERLHRLLSAHETLAEAIADDGSSDSARPTGPKSNPNAASSPETESPPVPISQPSKSVDRGEQATVLSRHTNYAIRAGWYPIVEAYDHSLDPGEKIAEGKRRRRQRLYGQEDIPGVAQLLDTPLFEQVSAGDLAAVRKLDRFAPPRAREIATRLTNRHPWLLAD